MSGYSINTGNSCCDICSTYFSSFQSTVHHLYMHHTSKESVPFEYQLTCYECEPHRTYTRAAMFRHHRNLAHGEDYPHNAIACNLWFKDRVARDAHDEDHEKDLTFDCCVACGSTSEFDGTVDNVKIPHSFVHCLKVTYRCKICLDFVVDEKKEIIAHNRMKHPGSRCCIFIFSSLGPHIMDFHVVTQVNLNIADGKDTLIFTNPYDQFFKFLKQGSMDPLPPRPNILKPSKKCCSTPVQQFPSNFD